MTMLRNYIPALKLGAKLLSSDIAGMGMTMGNVYYVIPSTKAFYSTFVKDYQCTYTDGSKSVYRDTGDGAAIQTAIDASKGGRNDYIFVLTGNYNLTAALTLAGKSSLHLIGVNGGGYDVGTMGAAALTQTGNYQNVIMSPYSELTGFQIINKSGYSAVTVATGIWRCSIHHNFFHMVCATGINIVDCTAGNANSYGRIDSNRFGIWSGTALLSAINCGLGGGVDVTNNIVTCQGGVTIDTAIVNSTTGGVTANNIVSNSGGSGTVTVAITISASGCAINNRCAVATGQGLAGGTADNSFVDNRDGQAGGAAAIIT